MPLIAQRKRKVNLLSKLQALDDIPEERAVFELKMAEEAEALMELHKITSVAILAHNIITHPTRPRLKMKIACLISDLESCTVYSYLEPLLFVFVQRG